MGRDVRPWKACEVKRASELWQANVSISRMAVLLDRTRDAIYAIATRHRELFPPRQLGASTEARASVDFNLRKGLVVKLKAIAKAREVSYTRVLTEVVEAWLENHEAA